MQKLWPGVANPNPFPELNLDALVKFASDRLGLATDEIEVFDARLAGVYGEHRDSNIAVDVEFAKSHLPHPLAGLQFCCVLLHELVHVAQLQQGRVKGPLGVYEGRSQFGRYGHFIHWWEGRDQVFPIDSKNKSKVYNNLPWEREANVNSLRLYHQAFDLGLIPAVFGRGAEHQLYSEKELAETKILV